MHYELCIMHYELCIMHYELCIMNYELCIMNYELKDLIIILIEWKRQNKNFLKTHSAN